MKSLFFFSVFALLLIPAGIRAQDRLCYALITVPKQEAPIVRYEMASAPANYFAGDMDFFTSTRGVRRLIYLGQADMAGRERAELKAYLPTSLTYRGPWEKCDTSIFFSTQRSGEGREATLTVDAKVLVQGNQAIDPRPELAHFTSYAATSQVPLRPNAWQEVAYWSVDHYCQMLWQYALVKDAPKTGTADPALPPLYRLEMIIGKLPEESLTSLSSSDAARRALIAESDAVHAYKWTAFSLHCLPGQAFSSRIALGSPMKRNKDADYEASCSCTFSGDLEIKLGTVALKSEFRTAAPKEEDRLTISLEADLVPGEWHIQPIGEKPIIYEFGHRARRQYQMIDGRDQVAPDRANAAFYRVVEVKR